MVGEPVSATEGLFLDTSLIVAATVEAHPSHVAAAEFVDDAVACGVRTLATRNPSDFKRYKDEISIVAV